MKTDWRRKLNILFMIAVLFLGVTLPVKSMAYYRPDTTIPNTVSAYNGNITMSIDYGFDHYAKYGRYMNVSAVITNVGDVFKGRLQIITPKAEKAVAYRTEVSVPSQTAKKITLSIPLSDDSGLLQVKLIDENQNTIVETNNKIIIGNSSNQAYIGILTENKENLEYLNSYATKAFYLDESNLPSDYLDLDILDVIIIDQYDTNKLSDKQLAAIKNWVNRGGSLVIGTGEYYEMTLAKINDTYSIITKEKYELKEIRLHINQTNIDNIKKHIMDYAEERKLMLEVIKSRNEELQSNGKNPIETDSITPKQWEEDSISKLKHDIQKKNVIDVILKDGITESTLEGNRLVQTRPMGRGMIQLFSYDLGFSSEKKSLGASTLITILDDFSNYKREQLQEEYYGAYSDYEIYSSMSYTDTKDIPNVSSYIIILLIYILLIGPASFIILKKFDKRSYTWIVVPTLAIIFTVVVYIFGSDTRISRPYAGYVNILTYQEDDTVENVVYFGLTAPNNQNYKVDIDNGYSIKELTNNDFNYYMSNIASDEDTDTDNYMTAINYGIDKTVLEINKNPAFSPIYYQTRHIDTTDNKLTYKLKYTADKITGTITNNFDFDLSGAILVCDGYLIQIGTIERGKTITINDKKSLFLTSRDIFYNNEIINAAAGAEEKSVNHTPEVDRKLNTLYYLGENKLLNDWDSNYIVAFIDKDSADAKAMSTDNLIEELSLKADCYGMKVAMFPIAPDYTKADQEFVPSIDSYMKITESLYDSYYSFRYLFSDNQTAEYHFPENDHITSFQYLTERNQNFESEHHKSFKGKIYFLNVKTGNYDEVFRSGVGSEVTDLSNYLTEQNVLTVRYHTDLSLQSYQMFLPYISYWKEAE